MAANRGMEHLQARQAPSFMGGLLARLQESQAATASADAPQDTFASSRALNSKHLHDQLWDRPPSWQRQHAPFFPQQLPHYPPPSRGGDLNPPKSLHAIEDSADGAEVPGGGGRLAISFLLNPTTGAGHKRKADAPAQDGLYSGTPSLSMASPSSPSSADPSRHQPRRRLEHDEPSFDDHDARHQRPQHPPHQHQHQHHGELETHRPLPSYAQPSSPLGPVHSLASYHSSFGDTFASPRTVLPSLSFLVSSSPASSTTSSSSASASSPPTTDLYHMRRTSPASSPVFAARTLPSFHSFQTAPSPASPSSSSSSFGLSLTAADPSFFFHSFNCLPSAMSAKLDSDRDAEPEPPPPQGSSEPSADASGSGFYYVPYERSRSAPASPKLFVGDDDDDDDRSPVGEEVEELYSNAPRQPTLSANQLQLRLQTQALQTQLLLRQKQRTQNIQQLKRLHAQQRRQRAEAHSASASFASSPARPGEGGRQSRRRLDDDDDDGDDGGDGGVDESEEGGGGEKRSAFGQHQDEEMARNIKNKLLKIQILDSGNLSNDEAAKSKEKRKRATPGQLKLLEDVFALYPFPEGETKKLLAQKLGMSVRSVTIWFQNKRARLKKLSEKNAV